MVRRILFVVAVTALVVGMTASTASALTQTEELGKALFFDANLSYPAGQSCAACHAPEVGWTGPHSVVNAGVVVYEGANAGMFGDRKPPAAAYGGNSPVLYYDADQEAWVGGMFWDGRATGWTLGDPLAEQALGPFLNSREQNLSDAQAVIDIVKASDYADDFEAEAGMGAAIWLPVNTGYGYEVVGRSIAGYERSSEVSSYSSKYDAYLAGTAKLTGAEKKGMALFFGKAECSLCHAADGVDGAPDDFTDFTYDNLGIPKNPMNPVYDWFGMDFVDPGLGGFLESAGYDASVFEPEWGKHKVPTLRNVDLRPKPKGQFVKAYGHNGYFKSLKEIVHFYNTRDVPGAGWKGVMWPLAEYADTVNTEELGNLGLTDREEDDLVEFMKTLNDGYKP